MSSEIEVVYRFVARAQFTRMMEMLKNTTAQAAESRKGAAPDFLGGRIYAAFKRDIITGVLRSGEPLSEKVLASRYGASRTPLREAAVRLEQENLLRIIPNKGCFIAALTVHEVIRLYEYRAAIEGVCAEIAAGKVIDAMQWDELERLANVQYDDRASYFRFVEADSAFHVGIARLTDNHLLVKAVADVRVHMERLMYAASSLAPYSKITSKEHLAIIEAVRNKNPKLARQLVHRHILGAKEKVLELAGERSSLL